MKLLQAIAAELYSMFMSDARLTILTVTLVIFLDVLLHTGVLDTTIAGVVLLSGCLLIVLDAVVGEARRREPVRRETQRTRMK